MFPHKHVFHLSIHVLRPPGNATSVAQSSTSDPAEAEAMSCLERGTQKLEEGDVEGAKALYKRSVEIKKDAGEIGRAHV